MIDKRGLGVAVLLMTAAPAVAQFDSGSNGSDSALLAFGDYTIDLRDAAVGPWDTTPHDPGQGVYDPYLWAVVFQYTTIDVVSGADMRFVNHPSGAPVVWLASGNVNIGGEVNLNGEGFATNLDCFEYRQPGPGGFAGGARAAGGFSAGGGFGPGGGIDNGGSYGSPGNGESSDRVYGNAEVYPLIGGSGGAGGTNIAAGAGGGAILIASSATVTIDGSILARGGYGNFGGHAGSGGAIRVIANAIAGIGSLDARGNGSQGVGRIRLEAYDMTSFTGDSVPNYTTSGPGPVLETPDRPRLAATMVDGTSVPADPIAGIETVDMIVHSNEVTLQITAENVPPGTSVSVIVQPAHGEPYTVPSTPLAGSFASSQAFAVVPLPPVQCEIQLKTEW